MQKRRVISAILVLSLMASMTACAKSKKNDKAVISAANEYAEALLSLKGKTVAGLSKGERDLKSTLESMLDFESSYGDETGSVYNAIVDEMTFEVDEDSVDTDSEDGQIDVVFTMPDYESVASDDDNMISPDAFIDALDDADTVEVIVTLEFELVDGDWLVTNYNKAIPRVFPFMESNITFLPDLVSEFSGYSWYSSNNGVYTNASYINFWGQFNNLDSNEINVYFTVERDGVLIYTSSVVHSGDFYYRSSDDPDSVNDCVPAGEYTVSCYDTNDRLIASGTCTVICGDIPADSYFDYWIWYGNFNEGTDGSIVYTDVTSIDLDCLVNSPVDSYYTVMYNGTLIYTSEVTSYTRIEGYYNASHCGVYFVPEQNGLIPSGEYRISFYTASNDELIYSGVCTVINTDYPAGMSVGGADEDGRGEDEVANSVTETLGDNFLYDATVEWVGADSVNDMNLATYTSPTEIECICTISEENYCYYEVYYISEDSDSINDAVLLYTSGVDSTSEIAARYSAEEDPSMFLDGTPQSGFYLIIYGTSDNEVIAYSMCLVQQG